MKKKLSIHLSSDIHLEMQDPFYFPDPPVADVGIFAGDIGGIENLGQLRTFFVMMKERYEHIIWVFGNHELYYMDYNEAYTLGKALADELGIHLMDIHLGTENLVIDGVTFWATTFWTDFKDSDYFAKTKAKNAFNDFEVIKVGKQKLSPTITEVINKESRAKINWDADVIITHMAPVQIEHPQFEVNDLTWYFYNTGLEEQIAKSNVKAWLFGHTHHSAEIDLGGTRVLSNCHGFMSRWALSESSGYVPDLVIEI